MKLVKTKEPELKPLEVYESLDDLWLYNWSKMQEQNDVNWLRIDFDGRQKRVVDAIHILELNALKKRFEDEYFVIWDDDNFKDILKKRNEMNYYIALYDNVQSILNRMYAGFENSQMENRLIFIRQLKQLKYNMPEFNSVEGDRKELTRLYQQNEGIKIKIQLLADDLKVEQTAVTRSLNVELANISKTLELGYSINAKEITVVDWIHFQKEAKEIIDKRKLKE